MAEKTVSSPVSEGRKGLLRTILSNAKLPDSIIDQAVKLYEENPDAFEETPFQLANILTAMGVKAERANAIAQRFIATIHGINIPYNTDYLMTMPQPPNPFRVYGNPLLDLEIQRYIRKLTEDLSKEEEKEESKKLDKLFDKMTRMIMLLQLPKLIGGENPSQQFNPFMPYAYTWEPMVDENGKLMRDEAGRLIPRIKMLPLIMPYASYHGPSSPSSPSKIDETVTQVVKYATETMKSIAESERERAKAVEERYHSMIEDRLKELENRDTIGELLSLIDRLKSFGLGRELTDKDLKLKEMELDLKKWMIEKDHELKKWIAEERRKEEDAKLTREQIVEGVKTLRAGIHDIGSKIAKALAEGYREELTKSKPKPESTNKTKPTSESKVAKIEDVGKLSDEELLKVRERSNQYLKLLVDLCRKVDEEIRRRGLSEASKRSSSTPIETQERPSA